MKKIKPLDFAAVLFLTFGITYLDFNNLNFQDNIKAYIQLIIGAVLIIFVLYRRGQANRKEG